jgi:hypothetical protein
MRLFGRDLHGFAKILVILAAVFLVASGMCGLQMILANKITNGGGDILIPLGIAELAAMALSAMGIVLMLLAWIARAIYLQVSGAQEGGARKQPDAADKDGRKD